MLSVLLATSVEILKVVNSLIWLFIRDTLAPVTEF